MKTEDQKSSPNQSVLGMTNNAHDGAEEFTESICLGHDQ
jgi:hypothetical protein